MNGVRKFACGLVCFASFAAGGAHAATFPSVHSTDEQGHRHFRFTPDNFKENFLDTLYWSMVNGYQTGDIFEFEESDEPYVLTSGIGFNSGWGKHDLSFVGVKADGSPADPEKVVFIPAEGTQNRTKPWVSVLPTPPSRLLPKKAAKRACSSASALGWLSL